MSILNNMNKYLTYLLDSSQFDEIVVNYYFKTTIFLHLVHITLFFYINKVHITQNLSIGSI